MTVLGKRKREQFSIAYHGNYCGPGWSAGKYQNSVCSTVPALDEFDMTCKEHDCAYATPGADLKAADEKFYSQNRGKGFKRHMAAIAVGTQGFFRDPADPSTEHIPYVEPKRAPNSDSTPFSTNMATVARKGKLSKGSRRTGGTRSRTKKVARRRVKRKNVKKSKKVGRKSRKKNSRKSGKGVPNIASGLQFTRETGGVAATIQPAMYLGHATFPLYTAREYFWGAVIKALCLKIGMVVPAIDDIIFENGNDKLFLSYILVPTANTVEDTILIGTTGFTLKSMMEWFANPARPWNDTAIASQVQFNMIKYVPFLDVSDGPGTGLYPKTAPQWMSFNGAKMHWYCRSEFKMQNRSVAASADDYVTNIDNVPLYANIYQGKGNGVTHQIKSPAGASNLSFVGDTRDAIIGRVYSSTNDAQGVPSDTMSAEPPAGVEFGCKKTGRVIAQPGKIDTSVLTDRWSVSFNKLYQKISFGAGTVSDGGEQWKVPYGKFRMFGFDKMIETLASSGGTVREPMRVAFEHNLYTTVAFTAGHNKITTQAYSWSKSGGA